MAYARLRRQLAGSASSMPRPARSTGTTTTSTDTRRPTAGPTGVSTVAGAEGTSRIASVASRVVIRAAARRNVADGVRLSRNSSSAS